MCICDLRIANKLIYNQKVQNLVKKKIFIMDLYDKKYLLTLSLCAILQHSTYSYNDFKPDCRDLCNLCNIPCNKPLMLMFEDLSRS